jgi:hypothetical protein
MFFRLTIMFEIGNTLVPETQDDAGNQQNATDCIRVVRLSQEQQEECIWTSPEQGE